VHLPSNGRCSVISAGRSASVWLQVRAGSVRHILMKKTLLAGVTALMMATSAAHATEYQGKLPTQVQRLPKYPPVVCVAPNWATEPCENRQSKSRLSESEPKMQRVGVALEYPKELPDNAPGWFSRKDWLPPKPIDPKVLLKNLKQCEEHSEWWCFLPWLELLPKWMKGVDHPLKSVAVQWPTSNPIVIQHMTQKKSLLELLGADWMQPDPNAPPPMTVTRQSRPPPPADYRAPTDSTRGTWIRTTPEMLDAYVRSMEAEPTVNVRAGGYNWNPAAWNAWLAGLPESKNVEDRRKPEETQDCSAC
jgi:hypothetical protein